MSQTPIVQTDRLYLGHGTEFVHVNPGGSNWASARGCGDAPLVSSWLNARHQSSFSINGEQWTPATTGEIAAARDLWGGVCRCERLTAAPTGPQPTVDVTVEQRMPLWERAAVALGGVLIVVCSVLMIWGGVVLGGVR